VSILGVGTDIIEIARVREVAARQPRFMARVFTEAEIAHIEQGGEMKWARAAGKFAAKEAIAKAIGRPCSWRDIEVLPADNGRPTVVLRGRAAQAANGARVRLSISHSRDYTIAVAVLESE